MYPQNKELIDLLYVCSNIFNITTSNSFFCTNVVYFILPFLGYQYILSSHIQKIPHFLYTYIYSIIDVPNSLNHSYTDGHYLQNVSNILLLKM